MPGRVTLSEELRSRIVGSLNPKPPQSLSDFRADWLRRFRDAVEDGIRKGDIKVDIEKAWPIVQAIDAKFSHFYGDVETEARPFVGHPAVREVLRGAPTLLAEAKATQQE